MRARAFVAAVLLAAAGCSPDQPAPEPAAAPSRSESPSPSPAATIAPPPRATATPSPRPTSPRPTRTPVRRTATPKPPPPRPTPAAVPPFSGSISPIDPATRARMRYSWREGCPVAIEDLRILRLDHWTFGGGRARGELVVHADVAPGVLRAMRSLWQARFPIRRMRLIDDYGGSDDRSMAADNTSAFNCRTVKGTSRWSEHSYGRAIDINPIENPWVSSGGEVDPPAGQPYADRSRRAPGMIHAGDAVVDAFAAIGWRWGGYWSGTKDYQHFSRSGR